MLLVEQRVLPALDMLAATLRVKAEAFSGIVKIGRTHLQDATPLTLGQEFSAYGDDGSRIVRRLKGIDPAGHGWPWPSAAWQWARI